MEKKLPGVSLVLGGAACGKSRFAETLCEASGLSKVYVATSQVWDDETALKVKAHKKQRGLGWITIEEPRDLASVLQDGTASDVVLVDCMTLWLTNVVLAEEAVEPAIEGMLRALAGCAAPIVLVSNELGMGIVPENALARRFRNEHGRMNQKLAETADLVVHVVAGLPQVLKGQMP